jgi:putative methyltransferase (TIGR04325 family)
MLPKQRTRLRSLSIKLKIKISAIKTGDFRSFNTYEEAVQKCKKDGYANTDLISSIVIKTEKAIHDLSIKQVLSDVETLRILYLILNSFARSVLVTDFGGGAGIQFFKLNVAGGSTLIDKWTVIETPEMTRIAKRVTNPRLEFIADFSETHDMDIFLANSSIQYCNNLEAILSNVIQSKPKYIYISRTPFNLNDEKIIAIQKSLLSKNGPRTTNIIDKDELVEYPIIYHSYKGFQSLLDENYELLYKTDSSQSPFNHLKGNIQTLDLIYRLK